MVEVKYNTKHVKISENKQYYSAKEYNCNRYIKIMYLK